MAFRLQLEKPVGDEVLRVAHKRIKRAIEAAADAERPLLERIHEARTSCKRVRSALRLVRSFCPDEWGVANERLRDAGRMLSPLRDATLMPATLTSLLRHVGDTADPRVFQGIRRQLLSRRRKAMNDATEVRHALNRFVQQMRHAAHSVRGWKVECDASQMIEKGFARDYRRARRAWRRVARQPSTAAFHEWRKCVKTHSHHCQLFRCAWPDVLIAWQCALNTIADCLGDEHDLAVLADYLNDPGDGLGEQDQAAAGALRSLIAVRRDELRAQALVLGERLFGEKPATVARRLTVWWETAVEVRS